MQHPFTLRLFYASVVVVLLACNGVAAAVTPAVPPSPVPATSAPLLSQQVALVSQESSETNQTPPFTIKSRTPQLGGSDDPRVAAFNQRARELVAKEVESFRQSFLQNTAPPVSPTGSSLDATYSLVSQMGEVWSFKFDFSFYSDGAAHPGLYSVTLNYDLGQGRELALADLFLPNTNYLETISQYCLAELSTREFFDSAFMEGAQPTLENYRN